MNWVHVALAAIAGACLTIAALHALLWLRQRRLADALFAVLAVSVAVISVVDLVLMNAPDVDRYGELTRWGHLAGGITIVSLALFIQVQFPFGRAWLCWAVVATRTIAVVANFVDGANLDYVEMLGLRQYELAGGVVGVLGTGRLNPWMLVAQAGNLLLLVYIVDVILRAGRQGNPNLRRHARRIGGAIAVFLVVANTWRLLVTNGILLAPDVVSPFFLIVLAIASHELIRQVLQADVLSEALSSAQRRLDENERRLDIATSAAGIGPMGWDVAADRIWLSDPARALLSDRVSSFDRAGFLAGVHPGDRAAVDAALMAAGTTGAELRLEFRWLDSGAFRWLALRGQGRAPGEGAPLQFYGMLADITERRQQAERFQAAVEASPTVMLLVDSGGIVRLANRRAEAVLGYSPAELVGRSIDQLVPDRTMAGHGASRAAYGAAASARPMGGDREVFARHRDGSEVPVEIVLNPLRIGDELHVLASLTDVSEQRRMQREMAVHREELAHLSRVAMLAELSGSLAHELNQPLTAILSNAQAATRFLAADPPDLAEVRESLLHIVDSDRRAGEVIRKLRAMLRREPPEHSPLDINDLVLDVLRIIRSDLLNRSTETSLSLAPDLPAVLGDRIQLQQVLLNLVMNGCDAMADVPPAGRQLVVGTQVVDGGVEISVTDRGLGIPPEDLERVFAPFFTTKRDGMGLGLAVCRTIVESHRGRLWADSAQVGGATLRILVPALETPPVRARNRTDRAPEAAD